MLFRGQRLLARSISLHHFMILALLLVVSEVNSQQILTLQFGSDLLQNNSIFPLDQVGEDDITSIQCLTSRTDCCDSTNSARNVGTGHWYSPSGSTLTRLAGTDDGVDFYRERFLSRIDLRRRNNATSPEGIYRCEIPKVGSTGDTDVVWIGLYLDGNGAPEVTSLTSVTVPDAALICTSSGGPTTTVTWTQDGVAIDTSGPDYSTSQTLVDGANAVYESMLTASVREDLMGSFTCTVSNSEGNSSMSINVVFTERPTIAPGVHLLLNNVFYPNNTLFSLEDISRFVPLFALTDNTECCSIQLGHWNHPNGSLVQNFNLGHSLYQEIIHRHVRLHRRPDTGSIVGGIYECFITDPSGNSVFLYAGVYNQGEGSLQISNLFYEESTLTLTCTSTGGPATYVTWLKDGRVISEGSANYSTSQRIMDKEAGTYENILEGLVIGSLLGNFTCRVENAQGSVNRTVELDTNHPPVPVITGTSVSLSPSSEGATPLANIQLQWMQLDNSFVREYRVTLAYVGPCPEGVEGGEGNVTTIGGNNRIVVIEGLRVNAQYAGTMVAINDRGSSNVTTFNITTPTAAPSGVVQSLMYTRTMTSISMSWGHVPCLQRNSEISGYRLTTESSRYGTMVTNVTATVVGERVNVTLERLIPSTLYMLRVAAINSQGQEGPMFFFNITMLPVEGLVFQLNGTQLSNNSVVDPSDIGEYERGLFCLTRFTECCRGGVFGSRGNWVDERGVNVSTLPESQSRNLEFYNNRGMGAVRLNRRFTGPSNFSGGMYKCVIPDENNVFRELFIGIFPPDFGIPVVTALTYDPSTMTLLCVSMRGPATTVTWTQDQSVLQDNGDTIVASQSIISTETDTYHNTLRVQRTNEFRNIGTFRCHVGNNRGNDSTQLAVVPSRIISEEFRIGSPASLNCTDTRASDTTSLSNVVQWLNGTGDVVAVETNASGVGLRFEAADLEVNDTVYLCRVTDHVTTSITIRVQDSGPPLSLTSMPIPSGFQFDWETPEGTLPSFFSYLLRCQPQLQGLPSLDDVTTATGMLTGQVMGMEDGSSYDCSVRAMRTAVAGTMMASYSSLPATIFVRTQETVPTASPSGFRVQTNDSRRIGFSWEAIPLLDRNGIILDYTISCNASTFAPVMGIFTAPLPGANQLDGFRPDTRYSCLIFARNSAGSSPSSDAISVNSGEEKSLFQVELSRVENCFAWRASQSVEKADSIRAELIASINAQCPDCELTDNRIRNDRLDCFDSSLQTVTYRAEVHGTQDRTSEELIREIEALVRRGGSIRVRNVAMTFVDECLVEINSFDEGRCANVGAVGGEALPLVPIIVGGAVGGVSVLAVCCIVVVIAVLVRQRRTKQRGSIHRRNLNEVPYTPTLQTESMYERIPELPPRSVSGKGAWSRNGAGQGEECTSFQNRSFRVNSTSSLRYVPSIHPEPLPSSPDGVYVEIDEAQAQARQHRRRANERRPSDYEPVLIRDPVTGRPELVSTEDSHPLSPSRSTTSSLRRDGGMADDDEIVTTGKLNLTDIPPLHPSQSGNDYAIIPNVGFQSHENSPPLEFAAPSTDADVMRNEGFSENSESGVRKYSVSNNPMYSTVAGPKRAKVRVSRDGNNDEVESMRNPNFVEYDVPPDGTRAKPPAMSRALATAGTTQDRGSSQRERAGSSGPSSTPVRGSPADSTYNVPRSNTIAVPSASTTYDVPSNNTPLHTMKAAVPASTTYDVPTNNTPILSRKAASANTTYDVPTNNTPILSRRAVPATYDVPTNNTPILSRKAVPATSTTYDVPTNNSPLHNATEDQKNDNPKKLESEEPASHSKLPSPTGGNSTSSPTAMESNPSYFAYTVPTKSPNNKSSSSSRNNDTQGSNSNETDSKSSPVHPTPSSTTYDVPPTNHAPHAPLVMLEIRTRDPRDKKEAKNEEKAKEFTIHHQAKSDNSSLPPHDNMVAYDIPPLRSHEKTASEKEPTHPSTHATPTKRPREVVIMDASKEKEINSSNSPFYKYDIPPSNMPAPKLHT